MEGWYGQEVLPMFRDVTYLIPKTEYTISKGEISSYFTDTAMLQIDMWQKYKLLGLPFSCGWAEHPAVFIDIISAIESESNKRK